MKDDIVFGVKWFERHQRKLLWLLNTPIIKIWFRWVMRIYKDDCPLNVTINKIGPNCYSYGGKYINDKEIEVTTQFITQDLYSKRLYLAFKPFWYLLHFLDWVMLDRIESAYQLSFGFSTLTKSPGSIGTNNPVQGETKRGIVNPGDTFANMRAGAGTYSNAFPTNTSYQNSYITLQSANTTPNYIGIYRGRYCFDTSALTSGATISAAVFSIYSVGKQTFFSTDPDIYIAQGGGTSTSAMQNSDYDQANHGTTSFGNITYTNYPTTGYADFTVNATGIAAISKTGITQYSVQTSWDILNSPPTWTSSVTSGFSIRIGSTQYSQYLPTLVVTYTVVTDNGSPFFGFL